jgi:uncharacterized protein (TIGR02118 family)
MHKLTILYRQTEDNSQTDDFFSRINLPMAEQLPGLLSTELSRTAGKPQGAESRFYIMYELYFANQQTCYAAMQSDMGRAMTLALQPWAEARVVSWFYAETFSADAPTLQKEV